MPSPVPPDLQVPARNKAFREGHAVGTQNYICLPSGARLTKTSFIRRLNTVGGITPSTGCAQATDVDQKAFVPYTADCFFYKADERD